MDSCIVHWCSSLIETLLWTPSLYLSNLSIPNLQKMQKSNLIENQTTLMINIDLLGTRSISTIPIMHFHKLKTDFNS